MSVVIINRFSPTCFLLAMSGLRCEALTPRAFTSPQHGACIPMSCLILRCVRMCDPFPHRGTHPRQILHSLCPRRVARRSRAPAGDSRPQVRLVRRRRSRGGGRRAKNCSKTPLGKPKRLQITLRKPKNCSKTPFGKGHPEGLSPTPFYYYALHGTRSIVRMYG